MGPGLFECEVPGEGVVELHIRCVSEGGLCGDTEDAVGRFSDYQI